MINDKTIRLLLYANGRMRPPLLRLTLLIRAKPAQRIHNEVDVVYKGALFCAPVRVINHHHRAIIRMSTDHVCIFL